jgi:hypothetical protein
MVSQRADAPHAIKTRSRNPENHAIVRTLRTTVKKDARGCGRLRIEYRCR